MNEKIISGFTQVVTNMVEINNARNLGINNVKPRFRNIPIEIVVSKIIAFAYDEQLKVLIIHTLGGEIQLQFDKRIITILNQIFKK